MAYYRKCDWCGKEYMSYHGFKVCGPVCSKAKRLDRANEYARQKNKKRAEMEGREIRPYKRQDKEIGVTDLKKILFADERKPKSCMFCSKVNSTECGRCVFDGSPTGGRYKKIPDRRCDAEL